ncbi:MAG: hydrolase [Gammaproteobacteria bacterium]|nr:hydrolase [Gammaproteobacteria bacterium]
MCFACPCCRCLTFDEEPPGTFDICPVCGWEDDDVQFRNPNSGGGANVVSLNQARENYSKFGAVDRESLAFVRKPSETERPK